MIFLWKNFSHCKKGMLLARKRLLLFVSAVIFCVLACVITGVIVNSVSKKRKIEKEVPCIDGCDVPRYDEDGNEIFAVVSPVGYNKVDMIEQAPRLDTLDGKKIALIGGSFMASTTHFELKKCIEVKHWRLLCKRK